MTLSRRQALALVPGAAALAAFGPALIPSTARAAVEDAIAEFTGGATPGEGRITLDAPEIAENGNSVPVAFSVESPMTDADHVASVLIIAAGNPTPKVATLHFTPMSGKAEASTRLRLARTQNVMVVAKMSDGSVFMDQTEVKVTIGGCGG